MTPQLKALRCTAVVFVAGLLFALMIFVAPSSFASLTVTDPEGNPPDGHFTDLTMVPGDTNSTTLVLAQDTEHPVHAGIRLEPLSEPTELHDAIDITVEGLGSTCNVSLTEAVQRGSPLWIGELPPQQDTEITLTAHLPFAAGNETKQTEAPFKVIVTAQEMPPAEPSCQPNPPTRPEEKADENSRAQHLEGELPDTGTESFLIGLLAVGLLLAGLVAWRFARHGRF